MKSFYSFICFFIDLFLYLYVSLFLYLLFYLFIFQEYEETCLFIIAQFSASESLRVYINILKIRPPFASSDGYPASGIRYESVGA